MTEVELLRELLGVSVRLGIEVRWETGDFRGGLLRVRQRRTLLLNPAVSRRQTIDLVCRALSGEDLSRVFILPALRRRLDPRNL